mmetsp:Transcript_13630/g.12094  ORF Transcript_13630/g.12094 Transcript_13630/m.12094 type:complete len:106 (-) Transcript_13630:438-755(-)
MGRTILEGDLSPEPIKMIKAEDYNLTKNSEECKSSTEDLSSQYVLTQGTGMTKISLSKDQKKVVKIQKFKDLQNPTIDKYLSKVDEIPNIFNQEPKLMYKNTFEK